MKSKPVYTCHIVQTSSPIPTSHKMSLFKTTLELSITHWSTWSPHSARWLAKYLLGRSHTRDMLPWWNRCDDFWSCSLLLWIYVLPPRLWLCYLQATNSEQTYSYYLHMTSFMQTMVEEETNIICVLKVKNIHAYISTTATSTWDAT